MQYYIKDNFYFDIDQFNQLRITGVENHLLLGLSFPEKLKVEITEYGVDKGQLWIKVSVPVRRIDLPIPLVTDIRTLRSLTEPLSPRPKYVEVMKNNPDLVKPRVIKDIYRTHEKGVRFINSFKDELGTLKKYGSEIVVSNTCKLDFDGSGIHLNCDSPIEFLIRSVINIKIKVSLKKKIFKDTEVDVEKMFNPNLLKIYADAKTHVEHLIKAQKTSSFEYGTIFPRDWIESADLGSTHLTSETIDYMYDQAMSFVSEKGEGWHENLIGEYRTKTADSTLHIDRKMIDIEPRYILGLRQVSKKFLMSPDHQKKLRLVARFLLDNAEKMDLISFKKVPNSDHYEVVGNGRDSYFAYPRQKAPLAPYDVNCLFYPESLKIIREYHQFFQITDVNKVDALINKWDKQKYKFRLYHPNDVIGYSLALHGHKHKPLPTPHLDESYDLFYSSPSMEEIVSFAEKIKDPSFFYTPSGPLLVAADEDDFSTAHYHGKVIWPKQAAYSVAGMTKQYFRGVKESWPWPVLDSIKEAVVLTCEACFKGWQELGCVPELYYYDSVSQRARLYTDQESYEGQMSIIQLWSSLGCLRIMHDYTLIMKNGAVY